MHRPTLALLGALLLAGPALAQAPAACPADFQGTAKPLACQCSAEAVAAGTVWGTGVYSNDSSICRAARHLGVIGAQGGAVRVVPAPGLPYYAASTANGVTTQPYDTWGASFTFRP